jgi:hypothetical protein
MRDDTRNIVVVRAASRVSSTSHLAPGVDGVGGCLLIVRTPTDVTPNRRVIATLWALIARLHVADTRFCPPLVGRCDREMQDIQGNKAGRVREELQRATKYLPRLPQSRLVGLVRLSQSLTTVKI